MTSSNSFLFLFVSPNLQNSWHLCSTTTLSQTYKKWLQPKTHGTLGSLPALRLIRITLTGRYIRYQIFSHVKML